MMKDFVIRDLDRMIKNRVYKERLKKRVLRTSLSIVSIFVVFVMAINLSDQFYAYAIENQLLNPIVKPLRFLDIYEEAPSEIIEKETFSLRLLETGDKYNIEESLLDLQFEDGSYLIYSHTEDDLLYFIQYEKTEGLFDVMSSIWSYSVDSEIMSKILDLETYNGDELLTNYRVIDGKIYMVSAKQMEDGSYLNQIQIIKDGNLIKEVPSLKMAAMYHQNEVNFMDDGNYMTLNEINGKYCYLVDDKEFKCYKGELSPDIIPIINLEAIIGDKYLVTETLIDSYDFDTGFDEGDVTKETILYSSTGEKIASLPGATEILIADKYAIIQHKNYVYSIVNSETGEITNFSDMSDLFYGLQDIGIETIAFELENTNIYSHLSSKNPFIQEDLKRFLSLTSVKEQVLLFTDESNDQLVVYKLTHD